MNSRKIAAFTLSVSLLTILSTERQASAQSTDGIYEVDGQRLAVRTVAEGINRPWGLAFLPNGDLLVTAKNGGMSRIPGGTEPAISVRALPKDIDRRLETPIDNSGLFDVAVDPDYDSTQRIFLSYTSSGADGTALKVSSFKLQRDRLSDERTLLVAGPRARDRFHYGGALLPLDDGTLLIASGERFSSEAPQGAAPVAQKTADPRGKIIRIRFDGTAPDDNPFTAQRGYDARIYALGIRNVQGIARKGDGTIWFSEHGPRAGDELNRLRPGGNYGWPGQTCGAYKDRDYRPPPLHESDTVAPVACWSGETVAPAGMSFYESKKIAAWHGKLLIAGLSAGHLLLVTFDGNDVSNVQSLFESDPQRLRDVAVAPDGSVYLAVDGADGRVVRMTPTGNAAMPQTGDSWTTCLQCHSIDAKSHTGTISLANVVGRPAGAAPGANYSSALRNSGIVWNAETLDRYLADPDGLIPGTTMPVRVIDAEKRRNIVDYLMLLGGESTLRD